ncbi:Hypothetical predicted protein [Mytilus galloprovincialis]|uniref:CCHC-type domain-containing protein n=1 Tax=Mytilus galloprovincialis TaxID=29158 RepID=A0A8B6BSY6_MYTGA|nr:Hypothetical predicted protein [Mytilus galloprovincialis]
MNSREWTILKWADISMLILILIIDSRHLKILIVRIMKDLWGTQRLPQDIQNYLEICLIIHIPKVIMLNLRHMFRQKLYNQLEEQNIQEQLLIICTRDMRDLVVQKNAYSKVSNMSRMSSNEPQHRLPFYNGKTEWESFWCQFQIISRSYAWDNQKQATQLLLCLQNEALNFASRLPHAVQTDIFSLFVELKKRFGDNILPSTHRAALQDLNKQNKESLQEFAYRVVNLISKAYPEIKGTQLFEELTVEHFLYGLNDENMTYDVISKQPKSIDEALNMVMWHESCRSRSGKNRKSSIREVQFDSQCEENDIRRLHQKQYVTEERLNQFGRELKDSIIEGMANLNKKMPSLPSTNSNNYQQSNYAKKTESNNNRCYNCNGIGHYSRNCPSKQDKWDSKRNGHYGNNQQRDAYAPVKTPFDPLN